MSNRKFDTRPTGLALFLRRLRSRRSLLLIICLMFVILVVTDLLDVRPAFICGAILIGGVLGERGFDPRSRKRARKRFDANETRVKQARAKGAINVIEALEAPALLLRDDRVVLFFNDAVKQLFPTLTKDVAITRSLRAPELLSALERLNEGAVQQYAEFQDAVKGRLYTVTVSKITLGVPAILLIFHDLTRGDKVERMRQDFVANASHELRTPLTSLKGYIETLQGNAAGDEKAQKKFLKIMAQQADRMQNLIDDMLSLSRLEMNEHIRPETRVNLGDVLSQQIAVMAPLAKARAITVQYSPITSPIYVFADSEELAQLFSNLILNAIKYGKEKGTVRVVVDVSSQQDHRDPQSVKIDIIDDGFGIEKEHIPRLTERFYRVDADASRAGGGTGLGLAIVKHITKRLNGSLAIHSKKNIGSTFSVLLPIAPLDDYLS